MFDSVVLAGGGKPEPLTEQEGVSNKAFIEVHGKPLLAYILQALQETPLVKDPVVIGPEKELTEFYKEGYSFKAVSEKGGMLDNLAAGFENVEHNKPCLVVTGDIPLLNAQSVENFLALCEPYDRDLYYPVFRREECLLHFPETERTYVRLSEGYITGGNLGLIKPAWFLENREDLDLFISYRKNPLKLLRIFPISFLFKYLLKTLSVKDLEEYLSRLLNLQARAVFGSAVEIAVDVDKPSDLELIKKVLKN